MKILKILREIKLLPKMKLRKPKKKDGEVHPRCGTKGCREMLRKITWNRGYRPKKFEEGRNPPERTKRGRPRKSANKRILHIGWWCPKCELFYYESGDILPVPMTVIIRLS